MAASPPVAAAKAKKAPKTKPRDKLIPRECVLSITHQRVSDIERELRTLSLDEHSNAVSVLFRVFVELSVDVYIGTNSVTLPPIPNTCQKLHAVVESLIGAGKLTKAQAKPVRAACQKNSFLSPTVDQMHDYVHNQHQFPAPSAPAAHLPATSSRSWSRFGPRKLL